MLRSCHAKRVVTAPLKQLDSSIVSSSEMSTANTCCVQLLRPAVTTSSAQLRLAGNSYNTLLHCQPEHFCNTDPQELLDPATNGFSESG